MMVRMQEETWERYGGDFSASGRALAEAVTRFQRLVFGAVDYLPPGEASFSEYGRALSTEVKDSFVTWGAESHWLAQELKRRRVITANDEIQKNEPERLSAARTLDVDRLIRSDTEAHQFVSRHRTLFNIPPRVPIIVHPRYLTHKTSGWGKEWDGTAMSSEVLLKVSWEKVEEDSFDRKFPTARSVTCGSTVILNYQGYACHLLSTDVEAQKPERDRMVRSLLEAGLLRPSAEPSGSDVLKTPIRIDVRKGVMKIRGAGRLLHFQRATQGSCAAAIKASSVGVSHLRF
jgi:hypothetical protein